MIKNFQESSLWYKHWKCLNNILKQCAVNWPIYIIYSLDFTVYFMPALSKTYRLINCSSSTISFFVSWKICSCLLSPPCHHKPLLATPNHVRRNLITSFHTLSLKVGVNFLNSQHSLSLFLGWLYILVCWLRWGCQKRWHRLVLDADVVDDGRWWLYCVNSVGWYALSPTLCRSLWRCYPRTLYCYLFVLVLLRLCSSWTVCRTCMSCMCLYLLHT